MARDTRTGGVRLRIRSAVDRIEKADHFEGQVLGGEGWKLRTFFVGGGLDRFLALANRVEIVTLEGFVAKANQGRL
jgi:hypothetical protein